MNVPLDISFQGLSHSRTLEAVVIENANGLTHVRHGIERCRVILGHGVQHPHPGGPFRVRIDVMTPLGEHVCSQMSGADLHAALRDAFADVAGMLKHAVGELRM